MLKTKETVINRYEIIYSVDGGKEFKLGRKSSRAGMRKKCDTLNAQKGVEAYIWDYVNQKEVTFDAE